MRQLQFEFNLCDKYPYTLQFVIAYVCLTKYMLHIIILKQAFPIKLLWICNVKCALQLTFKPYANFFFSSYFIIRIMLYQQN